ncbi:hypothetical protein CHUAL_002477 [Chamberlinius hualienensis]
MGKWRRKLNPLSLNNGHSENDEAVTPLRMNGTKSPSLSLTISSPTSLNGCGPKTNGNTNSGQIKPPMSPIYDSDSLKKQPFDDDVSVVDCQDKCGVGLCKPKWIQTWANKKVFLAVFCLTSVLQGMYYTYFVSVVTTIEKLFQIQSKTTGIIMAATEMGQIGGALLLTYYGGQGHRPKWIACGMIVFAVASFLCSLPHFLFGSELLQNAHATASAASNQTLLNNLTLCNSRYSSFPSNVTVGPSILDNGTFPSSMSFYGGDQCENIDSENHARITKIVLTIFFISLLFIGIGATAVYTLGIPYIDDNVANRDSPLYFAITIGVRILGPVFGFLLGSFCTSLYVEPFDPPSFNSQDQRWVGAWWLGLFIVAAALMVSSLAMFAFPKQLPVKKKKSSTTAENGAGGMGNNCQLSINHTNNHQNGSRVPPSNLKKPSLKDFPVALRRLLKNDILLCRTASSVLHILPIAGLYTFLPKYIENQFRMTPAKANMISGMAGILVMGVGIFASGTFMRRFKPNPRFVAAWIAITALAYAIGMIILMFLGCPLDDLTSQPGYIPDIGQKSSCNLTCNCNKDVFAPICTSESITYYSACHAGCESQINQTGVELFVNCSCLNPGVTATPGYCPLNCNNFVWYICIFSLFVLIHSTSEVGSMLLTLRCVDPKDKAMALGLISFAIGLFGNVPCPIIYGAVVDSACLIWDEICGKRGACKLYDPALFRFFFHGMTGAIMFVAFIVDVIVWYKAKNINFSDEDATTIPEEMMPMNGDTTPQVENVGQNSI